VLKEEEALCFLHSFYSQVLNLLLCHPRLKHWDYPATISAMVTFRHFTTITFLYGLPHGDSDHHGLHPDLEQ
jgi:hypothetical protein